MGATKAALTFILLVVTLQAASQLALGQSEVATLEDDITVDKEAPGTKLHGTLTIYYEPTDSCQLPDSAAKFFFMRLRMGNDLFPFSGQFSGKDICMSDSDSVARQQMAIEEFVKDEVIPDLFSCSQPSCPPVALKSVDQFVIGGNGVTEPLFVMMDFVIAVQEK